MTEFKNGILPGTEVEDPEKEIIRNFLVYLQTVSAEIGMANKTHSLILTTYEDVVEKIMTRIEEGSMGVAEISLMLAELEEDAGLFKLDKLLHTFMQTLVKKKREIEEFV